jgi:hypothetical protein
MIAEIVYMSGSETTKGLTPVTAGSTSLDQHRLLSMNY